MMKIEEIAKKILKNEEKTWKHTKRVVELCRKFKGQLNTDIHHVEILREAAWLHDTGKTTKYKNKYHHQAEVVREALEPYEDELTSDMDVLTGVIQAHKEAFNPPEGYELESAVLRICDKLDKWQKAEAKAEKAEIKEGKGKSKEEKGDNKNTWEKTAEKYQEAIQKYQEAVEKYREAFKEAQEAAKTCNDSLMKIKRVLAPDIWDAFEDAYAQVLAQMFQ